jgi:hypothetical protein
MRIEELTAGTGITFYANIGSNQQLTFDSKITEVNPKKHLVLADAIFKDDKVLSFKGNAISVDLIVSTPEDDKPILFKNISVETLKLADNSFCYSLSASKEGTPYNRRSNYRCFVGNPSILRDGKVLKDYDVILRDVSANGFAVTCGPELELENEQLVHVLLEDYLEELNQNYSFHLYGITVRRQELEHGKIVYGFRLNNRVGGLETYLTQKERLRIKKSRGR